MPEAPPNVIRANEGESRTTRTTSVSKQSIGLSLSWVCALMRPPRVGR